MNEWMEKGHELKQLKQNNNNTLASYKAIGLRILYDDDEDDDYLCEKPFVRFHVNM